MMEQTVLTNVHEGVGTLTLNRPQVMNAFNGELVTALTQGLEAMAADPAVRTVVLTGSGKAFSAGGDLGFLTQINDPAAAREFIGAVGRLVTLMADMKKPVIAMVNGVAAGAGFNLALAADIVFCAQSARFAQSFAKVGLIPDCGGFYLLPRLVGMHKAKELMFTADLLDAAAALKLGLVNAVYDDAVLKDETYRFAARLAQGAPVALGLIKTMVNRSLELDLPDSLELEASLQALCLQSGDYREGVAAFREKRSPRFEGK